MRNGQLRIFLRFVLPMLIFGVSGCLLFSSGIPFSLSKTENLGDFQKTSDGIYSWCGFSIGMPKEKAVQALEKQSEATYEWIFNADNETAIITDYPESTQTIQEEIYVECKPNKTGMVQFENGIITNIFIVDYGGTVQEYLDFFGDPEQYFATSVAHPMINETDFYYAFIYPTRGISFDGDYTNKETAPETLDLTAPITSIFFEDPKSFDAISTFYTQNKTDTRDYPRTIKPWSGRDSVEIEITTYRSF